MRRKISFRPNLVESRQCALVRKKEKRRLVDYSLDTGPPNGCLSVSCDWACGQRDWDVPATTPKTNWEDGSFHKLRILSGGVIDEVYSTWCVTDGYKTIVKIKVEDWRGDPLLIEKYYYLDFAEGKAIARSNLKKLVVDDVDSDRDAITRAFKRLEGASVDLECWATMHFVYYNIFNMNGTKPKSQ